MTISVLAALAGLPAPTARAHDHTADSTGAPQVPHWSADDMRYFLHGSLGTEFLPESVLKAFRATYPDLFPGHDFAAFGLIADPADDLPIGVSRRKVAHLGGLACIGINCASCHMAQVAPAGGGEPVRVLGATGHFDAEAFFGAVVASTFQTADPGDMARFLNHYREACEPHLSGQDRERFAAELARQKDAIAAAIAAHVAEERAAPADKLYELDRSAVSLGAGYFDKHGDNLTPVAHSMLQLFHNMRVALHVPHQPPQKAPPRSGPGRNNAFGSLSEALFNEPTLYAPAKFGLAWNLRQRTWVHWDGNTRSPIARNLAAALGLGAPLIGRRGMVEFAAVERHTQLTEQIRAPRYPWTVDAGMADRGRRHFEVRCASCHVHAAADEARRLYAVEEVKTDRNRARLFDDHQAQLYNRFFAELDVPGFAAPSAPAIRSTRKYVAADLAGVWARSPYLHNGSVRTMMELLAPASLRARTFRRGSRTFDQAYLGYADDGPYVFDTTSDGNSNAGHEYGTTDLTDEQKRELIEYLKTL